MVVCNAVVAEENVAKERREYGEYWRALNVKLKIPFSLQYSASEDIKKTVKTILG